MNATEKIKLTSMRVANIPPPMASHEIELPENAIDVAVMVKSTPEPTFYVGVLHRHSISVYSLPVKMAAAFEGPKFEQARPLPKAINEVFSSALQITNSSGMDFSVLRNDIINSYEWLKVSPVKSPSSDLLKIIKVSRLAQGLVSCGLGNMRIMLLTRGPDANEDKEGRLHQPNSSSLTNGDSDHITEYPVSSTRVEVVGWCSERKDSVQDRSLNGFDAEKTQLVFSLAENGNLFANGSCLVKNCTSFLVTAKHMIFTTSLHLLKFVHLGANAGGMSPLDRCS